MKWYAKVWNRTTRSNGRCTSGCPPGAERPRHHVPSSRLCIQKCKCSLRNPAVQIKSNVPQRLFSLRVLGAFVIGTLYAQQPTKQVHTSYLAQRPIRSPKLLSITPFLLLSTHLASSILVHDPTRTPIPAFPRVASHTKISKHPQRAPSKIVTTQDTHRGAPSAPHSHPHVPTQTHGMWISPPTTTTAISTEHLHRTTHPSTEPYIMYTHLSTCTSLPPATISVSHLCACARVVLSTWSLSLGISTGVVWACLVFRWIVGGVGRVYVCWDALHLCVCRYVRADKLVSLFLFSCTLLGMWVLRLG